MDIAANLHIATARALTDLHQYINSDLVFSDLKFRVVYSEIVTVEVVIPSGLEQKLLLALPSGNPLNLATSIGFSDLDPCDGGYVNCGNNSDFKMH